LEYPSHLYLLFLLLVAKLEISTMPNVFDKK
jgi:hypothetical protein